MSFKLTLSHKINDVQSITACEKKQCHYLIRFDQSGEERRKRMAKKQHRFNKEVISVYNDFGR